MLVKPEVCETFLALCKTLAPLGSLQIPENSCIGFVVEPVFSKWSQVKLVQMTYLHGDTVVQQATQLNATKAFAF